MHVMNKHVIVCLVKMPRHSGEKSFSVCRGRFAFKETLFSIALFSLCSLRTHNHIMNHIMNHMCAKMRDV